MELPMPVEWVTELNCKHEDIEWFFEDMGDLYPALMGGECNDCGHVFETDTLTSDEIYKLEQEEYEFAQDRAYENAR